MAQSHDARLAELVAELGGDEVRFLFRDLVQKALQELIDAELTEAIDAAPHVRGTVYAALVLQNELVRIDPASGSSDTLLTEADGLWNPASIAFGTSPDDRESLYVTNYSVLPPEPANSLGPAVLKFDVGTPGQPLG